MAQNRTAPRQGAAAFREAAADTGPTVGRTVVGGLLAGALAGMAMAMWTMLAGATFRDFGAFTPMYLIAARRRG